MKLRTREDLRTVFDDRGLVLGHIWQWPGRGVWGAVLSPPYAPGKDFPYEQTVLGRRFPTRAAAAAAVVAGLNTGPRQ